MGLVVGTQIIQLVEHVKTDPGGLQVRYIVLSVVFSNFLFRCTLTWIFILENFPNNTPLYLQPLSAFSLISFKFHCLSFATTCMKTDFEDFCFNLVKSGFIAVSPRVNMYTLHKLSDYFTAFLKLLENVFWFRFYLLLELLL